MSWNDAVAYCEWLSKMTGHEYRVPSEAEWEFACRAGTETAYSFGEDVSSEMVNYHPAYKFGVSQESEYRERTVPVNFPNFEPNDFGLYQMHGNVLEWCADDWADSYETPRTKEPFVFDPRGDERVSRGGSWMSNSLGIRSAMRFGFRPVERFSHFGFRVARTLSCR